jgi:hypothetical protein
MTQLFTDQENPETVRIMTKFKSIVRRIAATVEFEMSCCASGQIALFRCHGDEGTFALNTAHFRDLLFILIKYFVNKDFYVRKRSILTNNLFYFSIQCFKPYLNILCPKTNPFCACIS